MEDLSKYSTEELEAMLQDSPQPQSAQPSQTQAPQATQEPASDMPDLSQYSTEALERMIGEQGTAEGRIEQMFNVGTDRRDEIDPLEEAFKGAGRAVKAIGGAFVGLGSGAVRLAGTPVRALTGWDGLHRVADAIDSGYEDWGSEALASELPDDDWGRVLGGFGEKMAGTAGSLGAMAAGGGLAKLGAAGKFGAASKAVGTAGAALQKSLSFMFGNDAAVRTYDTAKENGSGTARALGLASVNGAIHYLGFKLFENQSLNKMLGMPQEMTAMMPAWANAAREGGAKTFTELASGVRNGMFKYILAERAKGALKAGGIMGLQNFLSSVPTQMAEGAGVGDVDWGRAVSEGVGGVEEGALMEGLMGGAAMLKTPKAARKFIADTYFRNGYDLLNGQHVPGLLHSEEGRSFVMKQNPEMQRRILDILDHGGKVTKGELNAACLPPDMTEAELREFAKDWRKDLASEWDRAAEPETLGEGEELEGNEPVIPREQQMRNRAKVNEMRDHEQRVAEAERTREEQAEDKANVAAEEKRWAEPNAKVDAERADEAAGAEQLAREDAYPQPVAEQPAAPEQAPAQEPTEPPVAEHPNRLRRNLKPNFRHQGENQQPKEVTNETGDVPVEARTEPPAQDAGRNGQQPPPQAAEGLVEGEAPRGEIPAAGEVAEASPVPAVTPEPEPVSKSDGGGQKLTGGAAEVKSGGRLVADIPVGEVFEYQGRKMAKTADGGLIENPTVVIGKDGKPVVTGRPVKERMEGAVEDAVMQADRPAAEPPKTAPTSAQSAEGTTTPTQSAEPVQGAETAAGVATGGAAEEPKPTQGNKLRRGKGKKLRTQAEAENDEAEIEKHNAKVAEEGDKLSAWSSDHDADDVKTGEPIIDKTKKRHKLLKKPLVVDVDGGWDEPDSDFASEDTKIKGRKVSPRVKAAWSELMEEAMDDVGGEGLSEAKLIAFAKEHGFDGLVLQGLHDPNEHGWTFGHAKVISFDADEAKAPKASAAPATREAKPESTTTPAPTEAAPSTPTAEQPQPASQFRDKNGQMKKTLRGAVERIASAIGNRTGKGAITPEEADGIVNGIAESPEVKHNRTRQFFTPLVTDAEWQNSLGVDAESAKNLRDAVARAKTDSEMAHFFVQVDKAVKKAKDGKLSPKDAVPLNGKISEGLEKAEREGRAEAAKRLREALEVIKPVVDAVSQEDVDKFNRSTKGKKLHTQLDGSDRRRGSRGKTISLDTKEGTVDVGTDGRTLEDVADEISGSSRDKRSLKPGEAYGKGFTAESDNDTTGTEGTRQGATGNGGRRGGNRVLRIEEIDGDDVFVSLLDSTGRDRGVTPQKMTREQWEMLAKAGKSLNDADPSNPQVGDNIMMSRGNAESPADRDAKFAADVDYQRWLKSRKANDAEPLRQRYEMEQAKALGDAYQNAVRGVDFEYVGDRDYDPAKDNPNGGRELKDRDTGTVLGIFDRDTGKLKLFRGANWKTLNHELGGHATMRLAEQEAERGNRALLDKINEAIDNAPQWLKDEVRRRYPDADEETLRDEIWAALRERPSEAMRKYVKTLQGRKWYNRAWDAIKTAWRGILSRMGFNRADLSGIDKMTPDEFNEFLDKAMIGGRTLGRLETQGGEGIGNKLRKAFIGERGAKRLGVGKFGDAEQMEKDGASREDIWRETGWWKGPDGKWRIEIPDAKFYSDIEDYIIRRDGGNVVFDMESAVDAPKLFKAYPELKDYTLEFTKLDDGVRGECDTRNEIIRIDRDVLNKRSTLVHELQHAVQEIEGFAEGSSESIARKELRDFIADERRRILNDPNTVKMRKARKLIGEIAAKYGMEDWLYSTYDDMDVIDAMKESDLLDAFLRTGRIRGEDKNTFEKLLPQLKKFENGPGRTLAILSEQLDNPEHIHAFYHHSAGETESRNVQGRLTYEPWERKYFPPWETADVPESEQIVRTGDGGGASESRGAQQSSVRMARGPVTPGPDVRIMDDEVKWLDRQGERFVDSTHNLRKVQNEVGYRDRSDPKSVGVEEVIDPKTGFVDWRKSSDIQKAIVKSNGFVQKNEHILQVRRDRATREMAKMKGLSEDAKRELVDDYLTALHAEERNRTIADRRGDTYNDDYAEGAGRSAKWARDFIANDPNVQKYKAELDRIADIVHEAVVEDLRLRHENGLLSDDEYNFYSKKWKHYVPLRTDVTEGSPEGGAFNTSTATFNRSEYRTAKGRGADNIASSPFAFAFVQAHDGIGKSARNIIGNVTANFIDMTEAKGLNSTKVEVVAKDGSKSTKTEYRIAEVVPADVVKRGGTKFAATFADGTTAEIGSDMRLASHQDNLVLFKRPEPVIGKDGKPTGETAARLYVAKFTEGKNGRGLAVAKAITGKNMVEVPFWVQPFSKATHFLSRMNTSASPSFLTSNIFNDRNEAWRAMSARFGVLDGAKMAAKVWKYRYADGKDLKNWLENGELRPGSDVADFINGGAAIKGGNIAQGFSGETSSLKDNLARQERKARSWWERFKRIGRFENVREIASSVGDVVQSANELEELGTRYGVYHAVLDELVAKGVPREVAKAEAVTFCRGATTDFNVRGTLAPVIGSFYMFYNANVQGTRRNIQSLTDKRGVQTFATLAGVASAMTVLRYWLGNDEEREKGGERNAKNALEYQKQSAMGIPIPSGRELSILKMRGVDALIPYAATKFTEAALYDDVSAMEALADSLKAAGGEALGVLGGNGVGNKSQISQTLAPSLADPFVQWATGTDWQGERRVKQLMDKTVPQSYNARHGTSDVFKWIAETVNDISGGNQYRKGVVDMAPEDVQLIVETLAGGLGRDITGAINTFSNVKEVAKGGSSERLFGRMPVVKSLVREYPDSTSRYFDALDEYNADKAEFKKTTELGRRAELKRAHPYLTAKKGRVDTLIEQVQELTHRERGEVKVGQKWVPMKTELPEPRKEAFRKRRLMLQAEVLRILGK